MTRGAMRCVSGNSDRGVWCQASAVKGDRGVLFGVLGELERVLSDR